MGVHRSGKRDKTQKDSDDAVGGGLKTADICGRQCAHGPSPVSLFWCSDAGRRPPNRDGLIVESRALRNHPAIGVGVDYSLAFITVRSQEETALTDNLPATRSRLKLDGHVELANGPSSRKRGTHRAASV